MSHGAFELTVGVLPNMPAAEDVLDAIISLLLDSGHLVAAGGDPVHGLRD